MTWETPKIDWVASNVLTAEDFKRIERNIEYLHTLLG